MERSTRQRAAIRAVMEAAGGPLTSSELFEAARERVPALAMTTVHRCLKDMLIAGEIVVVRLAADRQRYELKRRELGHHFRCTARRRVFTVDEGARDFGALLPEGFIVERQLLTVYGRCDDCATTTRLQPA